MKYILSVILSSILSLLLILTAWLQVPIKWVSQDTKLGSTITTISSSDTMSTFPTSYNATINSLNNTKLEISALSSTTSLPNLAGIGTITSGTWNGTKIGVAYGGTGSTTLSQYAVLLGSSTNAIDMVLGLGNSGQFLTSNGAGARPSWQTSATDQSLGYIWTGFHTFNGGVFWNNASGTNATTTNATTTSLNVSGLARFSSATTTTLFVSGAQTGGTWSNTGSSTNCNVTSGTVTLTNNIPATANFGLVNLVVNDGVAIQSGTITLSRAIQDGTGVYFDFGAATPSVGDGNYRFTWSGSTLSVEELTDNDSDSTLSCVAYWFK